MFLALCLVCELEEEKKIETPTCLQAGEGEEEQVGYSGDWMGKGSLHRVFVLLHFTHSNLGPF